MPVAQELFRFLKRAWNHVDGDEFSDTTCCSGAGFKGGVDRSNVSSNEHCDVTIKKVFLADKDNVGRLDHCVSGFNRTDQAECFNHP